MSKKNNCKGYKGDLGPFTRQFLERVIEERDKLYKERMLVLEKVMDERERLYQAQFKGMELSFATSLAAQEKAVNVAFLSAEKANLKSEQAQTSYNERSNEFRGQLDDQAKTLMPRLETDNRFKAIEEKIATTQSTADSRLYTTQAALKSELSLVQASFEKIVSGLDTQITSLRTSRDKGGGRDEASMRASQQNNWFIGLVVGILISIVQVILHFIK